MKMLCLIGRYVPAIAVCALLLYPGHAHAADVYARFKVKRPAEGVFQLTTGGFRHNANPSWYLPAEKLTITSGQWSAWVDMTKWPLHGRVNREGGIAEWPSMKVSLAWTGPGRSGAVSNCLIEGQLADKPYEKSVVISFNEEAYDGTIAFLVPFPLSEKKSEFETGSQMTARHLNWAKEAVGERVSRPRKFDICTTIWGHYDKKLALQAVDTLHTLGFNVANGAPDDILARRGMRVLGKTWLYHPDSDHVAAEWKKFADGPGHSGWQYSNMAHWVVSDESQALDFRGIETNKLAGWFRDYLKSKGVSDADIGRPAAQVEYPAKAMFEKTLPRDASLAERRFYYHAAKFGHWWSVKQMRQISDLIRKLPPGFKSETLPSDHGFFYAWGPPHIGMSYRMLDLFEIGAQDAVDVLSTEDWLGLNHMYGPSYTWSGGQTFGYLNAIHRSVIGDKPIKLLGLITPSDDIYLRLKAYSALCQGAKAFFFWAFGPTYIGTENYWSDLRSEYDGIAKLTKALVQSEDLLYEAKPVRDPVAILYSVSHDIWNTDNAAAFVEKRLTWHALRHLQVQPDFLREEDLEAGRLKGYKALFVNDWCISRKTTEAIGKWVEQGGVVWLSAGAATRDEYFEPFVPAFAKNVWPADAAKSLVTVAGAYNERRDLQTREAIDKAKLTTGGVPAELPVLGAKLSVQTNAAKDITALFADGKPAGAVVACGKGRVIAFGFMPMLAYGKLAGFKGETMEEKWPESPRALVGKALAAAGIHPVVKASTPVVEAALLTGPMGSAVVLANYTYLPISSLVLDISLDHPVGSALSVEGERVNFERVEKGVRITMPLTWTDIVLLRRE